MPEHASDGGISPLPGETWTPDMLCRLAEGLRNKVGVQRLARELNTSTRSIAKRIERYGLPQPNKRERTLSDWDAEEVNELRAMRVAGRPDREIRKHFNISKGTLGNAIKKFGLGRKAQVLTAGKTVVLGEPLGAEEREEVARLFSEGVSCWYIAERYDVAETTVRSLAKKAGVERPPWFRAQLEANAGHLWSEWENERLRALLLEDYSSPAIADELGLTRDIVTAQVRRLGLCLPSSKQSVGWRRRVAHFAARDDRVLRLHSRGLCVDEIAEEMTVGREAILRALHRLRARGHQIDFDRLAPWVPEDEEIALIAEGYRLGVRPETIADHCTASSGRQIIRVARCENISHVAYRKPHLQALRPEALQYHGMMDRLEKHLAECLFCFCRAIDERDVEAAIKRANIAVVRFPDMRPWRGQNVTLRANLIKEALESAAAKRALRP